MRCLFCFFSCKSNSFWGIQANSLRSANAKSLDSFAEISTNQANNIATRNAKSVDRAFSASDNNYITNIDITAVAEGEPVKSYGALSENGESCVMKFEIHKDRPGTLQNQFNDEVESIAKNNDKILLKKPQKEDAMLRQNGSRQGSIVHINPQEHTIPYCCTGQNMRSNEIRIVVNHRLVGLIVDMDIFYNNLYYCRRLRNQMKQVPKRVLRTTYRSRSLPTLLIKR